MCSEQNETREKNNQDCPIEGAWGACCRLHFHLSGKLSDSFLLSINSMFWFIKIFFDWELWSLVNQNLKGYLFRTLWILTRPKINDPQAVYTLIG